ncbi:MAG: O-acetyl-ADP-ribose deacetylase [Desulforudis sp.]|jgi:O-acetyl-ADP-ribose deacetylase (regulator of RNase III)|nr:MAG: O-acetyl-ADP-ribose deacetylase [Desulforudis sp.]
MEASVGRIRIKAFSGDLSQQDTDAIVTSTSKNLVSEDPVDSAIRRAGGMEYLKEVRYFTARHGLCPVGEAVVTGPGKLKTRHVIHVVGPSWTGAQRQEERLLRQIYWNALLKADELGVCSLALPSFGTGLPSIPLNVEAKVALSTICDFLLKDTTLRDIRLVLMSKYDVQEYQRVWEITMTKTFSDRRLAVASGDRQYA